MGCRESILVEKSTIDFPIFLLFFNTKFPIFPIFSILSFLFSYFFLATMPLDTLKAELGEVCTHASYLTNFENWN